MDDSSLIDEAFREVAEILKQETDGDPLHGGDSEDSALENLKMISTENAPRSTEQTRAAAAAEAGKRTLSKQESDEVIRDAVHAIGRDKGMSLEQIGQALLRLGMASGLGANAVGAIYFDDLDDCIMSAEDKVRVRAAMDSGACAHVINPDDLPAGAEPPGDPGKDFVGANNSKIKRYGSVTTTCEHSLGSLDTEWQAAAVSRPLHAVSQVCGPKGGPANSKHDVLFNNDDCFVVPPGTVLAIMKVVKAIANYPREGNLYLADMVLSKSFGRQGANA